MNSFDRNPKLSLRAPSAKSTTPNRGYFAPSHRDLAHHLQRTIENQAGQRLLRADQEGSSNTSATNHSATHTSIPSVVSKALASPGRSLDARTRGFMESRFNQDFSQVRVHDQDQASDATRQLNAQAFTVGNDIVLEGGEQSPLQRKELLAHELTHVVQQSKQASPTASALDAEAEADRNSKMISGNGPLHVSASSPAGTIQRQPKTKVSVESSGTKKSKEGKPPEAKNKYSFTAETKVPLPGHPEFWKLSFLDELNLKVTGEKTSEEPILAPVDLETLKIKMALALAKLELVKIKNARFGEFKVGAKIGADTNLTLKLGKEPGIEGEAGTSLGLNLGYKTPNLLPGRFGSLSAESKLSGTGSITGTASEEPKFTPKFVGSAGTSLKYSSPSFSGGLLGDTATVDVGAGAQVSGSITGEKKGLKVGGSGEIGLTGKSEGGLERFIKVKIIGDVALDQKAGEATSRTSSVMIGGFFGGSF